MLLILLFSQRPVEVLMYADVFARGRYVALVSRPAQTLGLEAGERFPQQGYLDTSKFNKLWTPFYGHVVQNSQ
jgi:hypothetical protein